MKLMFKTCTDFEKWFKQFPANARKLNGVSYTACRSPRGVELIPVISTAHLHAITDAGYERVLKFVEDHLGLREEDVPFCIAESTTT
jgi:hypothetical protein